MMKKVVKNLSTMALAVIIGVSAFGPIAHAMECSARSANSVACPTCGSVDVDELGMGEPTYSYADRDYHWVECVHDYRCNPCYTEFSKTEGYYEAHDYEFFAVTGVTICNGCYDYY